MPIISAPMYNIRIMSSKTKALVGIVVASLLWATAGLSKILVRSFDPYTAAFIRFAIASIVLLPIFLKQHRPKSFNLRLVIPIAILSTGNILFFYLGITTSTANASTIIYATTPLIVLILARFLIDERISRQKLAGIIVGLFGAVLIGILPSLEKGQRISGDITGNIFFGLAMVSWALYTIGSRHLIASKKITGFQLSSVSIFLSSMVFGIASFTHWKQSYLSLLVTPTTMLLFLHLGILVTVATYLLYQWSIQHSSATTASLNLYIQPVFAVFFNMIFLGERITTGFIIGSIFVFIGIVITTGSTVLALVRKSLSRIIMK